MMGQSFVKNEQRKTNEMAGETKNSEIKENVNKDMFMNKLMEKFQQKASTSNKNIKVQKKNNASFIKVPLELKIKSPKTVQIVAEEKKYDSPLITQR